ncbi:MAG: hypothetical protein KDD62_04735 [Bdellovibrionales bacterium]|nr:hypothetical protein [Bdellovibrionales bacterium]
MNHSASIAFSNQHQLESVLLAKELKIDLKSQTFPQDNPTPVLDTHRIYEAFQTNEGKTFCLNLSNGNTRRLHRELREHPTPRTLRELVGQQCHEIRALLGLQKKELAFFSALGEETFRSVEDGSARINIYRTYLAELPALAKKVLPRQIEQQQRIETRRKRVAKLLSLSSGLQEPINRLLWEVSLLIGPENFKKYYGARITSIRIRDQNGSTGYARDNYRLVKKFAELDCRSAQSDRKSPQASYQSHFAMKRLLLLTVKAEKDAAMTLGIKPTKAVALLLTVRALIGLHGKSNKSALEKRYQIPSSAAAGLARYDVKAVLPSLPQILKALAQDGVIVEDQLASLTQATKDALRAPTNRWPAVVDTIWQGLEKYQIDARMLAEWSNLKHENRVPSVKDKINKLVLVGNAPFSFNTLTILAADSLEHSEEMLDAVFAEIEKRSKNKGRSFSAEARTLQKFGVALQELPSPFHNISYPRYEEDRKSEVESKLLEATIRVGSQETRQFLNNWITMMTPVSIQALIASIYLKTPSLQPFVKVIGSSHKSLKQFASGEKNPSLPLLEKMITHARILASPSLYLNWNLQVAEQASELSPFARAIYVLQARQSDSTAGWYAQLNFPDKRNPPFSQNNFCVQVKAILNERMPTHRAFYEQRVRKVISFLQAGGMAIEILDYLRACHLYPNYQDRLVAMTNQAHVSENAILSLGRELKQGHRVLGIKQAMQRKTSIQAALTRREHEEHPQSSLWGNGAVVSLITKLPGITLKEAEFLSSLERHK